VRLIARNTVAIVVAIGMFATIQAVAHADAASKMIAVGAQAPAVVGKSTNAGKIEDFDLSKFSADHAVVLYFFPKAFTGGCTIEARTYGAKLDDFAKLGATVVGISADPIDQLVKFQAAEEAGQRFVSDPGGAIAKAYGVASVYKGDVYADRVTFVIGKDGKVLYSLADDSPLTNVQSTLDWLKKNPQT
jgi:peroxiredoxin Q/BCP